jgi:uncharacterized damage-inducible protein DinB
MKKKRHMIAAIEGEYRRYKSLGEGTFSQLEARDLVEKMAPESLSIAQIVWHVSGNLESRFTDFLTTDGEKPWRDRESEFAERSPSRKEMLSKWERGWRILFAAIAPLTDGHLTGSVTIRGIVMTVGEALERSLAHTSYHVGQITFAGKLLRRGEWTYLSIAPGQTAAYNANPTLEKARVPTAPQSKPQSKRQTKQAGKLATRNASARPAAKAARKATAKRAATKTRTKKKARR